LAIENDSRKKLARVADEQGMYLKRVFEIWSQNWLKAAFIRYLSRNIIYVSQACEFSGKDTARPRAMPLEFDSHWAQMERQE
jgi:hypothetical protein